LVLLVALNVILVAVTAVGAGKALASGHVNVAVMFTAIYLFLFTSTLGVLVTRLRGQGERQQQ